MQQHECFVNTNGCLALLPVNRELACKAAANDDGRGPQDNVMPLAKMAKKDGYEPLGAA